MKLLPWFLAAVFLTGCGKTQGTAARPASPSFFDRLIHRDPRLVAGARLYVDYGCPVCHGQAGVGGVTDPARAEEMPSLTDLRGPAAGPRILGALTSRDPDGRFRIRPSNGLENGWENMPNYSGILRPSQMGELVLYIEEGLPDYAGPLPTETGAEVYRAFGCEKCHGPLNGRGRVNPAFSPIEPDYLIPSLGPRFYRAAGTGGPDPYRRALLNGRIPHHFIATGYPGAVFMPALGRLMTGREFASLLNYLETGR